MNDLDETDVTPTVTPTAPANTADLLGPKLNPNEWAHVTAVYDPDAGLTKLYVNGIMVASKRVTGAVAYNTAGALTLGAATDSFIGLMDEVSIFSAPLSDDQILGLANLTMTVAPNPVVPTNTPTFTPTYTPTITKTPSRTPTATSTFTPTKTPTATKTATPGATPTATNTPTSTLTPTSTATFTATPTGCAPDPLWGTCADHDLSINSGITYNINTDKSNGRTCADAKAYSVLTLGSTSAKLNGIPADGCLSAGDEVMLINLQGTSASTYNTGVYEFLHVDHLTNDGTNGTVIFTTSKVNWYGDGWRSDQNIGLAAGKQRVMLMRVPNYNNVTVYGTLTANDFNGTLYGVVAFRVRGALEGSGTITASTLGYPGGSGMIGATSTNYWYGGGQAGPDGSGGHPAGGGGGYGTKGSNGFGLGGLTYGHPQLDLLFPGGGGGQGGYQTGTNPNTQEGPGDGDPGGAGGGIVWIAGNQINFSGYLKSKGGDGGAKGGGAGAGGSIRVEGYDLSLGNLDASG
ncbi:MAG TPA: LamG domain-containing protein, partial [Anaerolineales bacterium]|nr:LamG domain-containing protein [Anaerolineales bacterium]